MIDLSGHIKERVSAFIDHKYGSRLSLHSFLFNHPRRHLLHNNLLREIKVNNYLEYKSKKDVETKRKIINNLIDDFANMFCDSAIKHKEIELDGNIQENSSTD